jgi:hypothetical protein
VQKQNKLFLVTVNTFSSYFHSTMKIASKALLMVAFLSPGNSFSPHMSAPSNHGKESSFDTAMTHYEAALKNAITSTTEPIQHSTLSYPDVSLAQHIVEQQEAMEKYEEALRAALQSSAIASFSASTNEARTQQGLIKNALTQQESKLDKGQCWETLTQEIHSIINDKEKKANKPLTEEAKDEIIATAIAGSVLGTAVGSPLLVGVVWGYVGTQLLKGEEGDKTLAFWENAKHQFISEASAQAKAVLAFTQEQRKEEHDLSSVQKKILKVMEENAHAVQRDVQEAPTKFAKHVQQVLVHQDFRHLPYRTFNAFHGFLRSEEVKVVSKNALQAIRDGLESEEMKALQNRASKVVHDAIRSSKN